MRNLHGTFISTSIPLRVGLTIDIRVVVTGKRARAAVIYVDHEQPRLCGVALEQSQNIWGSRFFHLAMRRGRKIAKVAMARKLAVHLYWLWRQGQDYGQLPKLGSHAGAPGHPDGER